MSFNNVHPLSKLRTMGDVTPDGSFDEDELQIPAIVRPKLNKYVTVFLLCFINLINYMDRYTVAGVLPNVKEYYYLDNTESGLLQTSFIISFMIMAPLFGYLGDRYNRKYIVVGGVLFWCSTTLLGSFIPRNYFGLFIFLRALVGIGEASYSTVAATIIADLFKKSDRSRMLAIFYFAIPVGSGLGYVMSSEVGSVLGWQWSMRLTPILGLIAVISILIFVQEPPRGESEGLNNFTRESSIKEDLKALLRIRSFLLLTAGSTCIAFAIGALAWWAPTYMALALKASGMPGDDKQVGLKFGLITCIAGITGVVLGSGASQVLKKYSQRGDPLICAAGVFASVPLLFLGCLVAHSHLVSSWTLIFFGQMFLSCNWSVLADTILYVVVPSRRSISQAIQILFSHALGDAFSPYIIGQISDAIAAEKPKNVMNSYLSLQYSLFITVFVLVTGGFCFLLASFYVAEDRSLCQKAIQNMKVHEFPSDPSRSLTCPVSESREELLAWGEEGIEPIFRTSS